MSLAHERARRSWRVLSQLRQRSTSSLLLRPSSARVGLQKFRLHGPSSIFSSSCLHHIFTSSSFSTAAEGAHIANSSDPEAIPSYDSVSENFDAAFSSAMVLLDSDRVQEEDPLKKMLEEHRGLVSSLRAELEDQKNLIRFILDEIRVVKLTLDARTPSKCTAKNQLGPEWTAFMEHLQSSGFFKDEKRADGGNALEDPACVKRGIYKFSQAHDSVFESLSLIDLRVIARHMSTAKDPKAAASQKRLREFFHIEDTPSGVNTAKPVFTQPKLSDVTRLLYSTVLEPISGDEVKSSISHLLREIVTFSKQTSAVPPPAAQTSFSSKPSYALSTTALAMTEEPNHEKEKHLGKEKENDIRKVGSSKGDAAVKIAAKAEAKSDSEPAAPAPQWKCPRCSFMNLDTKHRCVECSRRRPQHTYRSVALKSTDGVSIVDKDVDVKVPVEKRQAKKAHKRKDSLPNPSTQGYKNAKDHSFSSVIPEQDITDTEDDLPLPSAEGHKNSKYHSSEVIEEQETTDAEYSSGEANVGNEGSEAFNVLDDILDSDDSDDEQQGEGEKAGLSDDSEEEKQGNGKRAALSNLFPKLSGSYLRRDDQRGSSYRNGKKTEYRPSKGRRCEDDGSDQRCKYSSISNDELEVSEEDDSLPLRSGRDHGDGYSHKPVRGGYNRFGARDGHSYGVGRGDSFDKRCSKEGLRAGSSYGDRDRRGKSSSYGSRATRGKPRF